MRRVQWPTLTEASFLFFSLSLIVHQLKKKKEKCGGSVFLLLYKYNGARLLMNQGNPKGAI